MGELKEKLKPILIVVGLSMATLFLIVLLTGSGNKPEDVINEDTLASAISVGDKSRGNLESQIVVTEFADFQCPACRSFAPILEQLYEEYGDKVAFQFRHFPLMSIHPNASKASRAAQVAASEGKFWEMHDLLYEKQGDWSGLVGSKTDEIFAEYASDLGIDVDAFKVAYESDPIREIVDLELDLANDLGLSGTPTIFVNDEQITSLSYQTIKDLIELQLSTSSSDE